MITYDNYWQKLDVLKAKLNGDGLHWDEETVNRFNIISEQLHHFIPTLDTAEQFNFHNSFMLQSWMNAMDLKFFTTTTPWTINGWDFFINRINARKGIICTYHFGAYQLITYLLNRDKVPFALLVGEQVYHDWDTRNSDLQTVLQEAAAEERFVLINASDRNGLKSMYSLADRGFHLLVYMDGLEGMDNSDNLVYTSFLKQTIKVPKGIAGLAHKLDLPLYPVIALREEKAIRIDSKDAICPAGQYDRALFAEESMRRLYGWLEEYVTLWPEQWTMWPHLMVIRKD